MSTMRKYTREFRESAVRLVLSGEVTLRKAAEDLCMPYDTLHGWVRTAQGAGRKAVPKEPPRTLADAEARVRALEAPEREGSEAHAGEGHPQKGGGALRAGAAVKYAFIRENLLCECSLRTACRLLEVSPSGYYRHLKSTPSPRALRRRGVEEAFVQIQSRRGGISGDLRRPEDRSRAPGPLRDRP